LLADSGAWQCEVCGKQYKYKYNLNQHRKFECGKTPQYNCQLCSYKAKWKGNLKRHFVAKHPDYPCP
jgi:hypothetical protein